MQISISSQFVAIRKSIFLKYVVVLTPLIELHTAFPFHVNCIAFLDLFLDFLGFFSSQIYLYISVLNLSTTSFCDTTTLPSLNKELYPVPDRIITENWSNWSHGPQPSLTQWIDEPCHVGPPETDGSWWRVLTKRGPLEKAVTNHSSIPALRTPWTVWKGRKIGHWKMNSLGQ